MTAGRGRSRPRSPPRSPTAASSSRRCALNAIEAVFALRREGDRLHGAGALPCGFMPLRGTDEARPWRWRLGGGGGAMADADLGNEGRGNLDRLLAGPPRDAGDPLAGIAHPMDALLWLALDGDPLLSLTLPHRGDGPPPWTLGLDVLPASLLVLEFAGGYADIAGARLYGGDGALRTFTRRPRRVAGRRAARARSARAQRRAAPRPQRLEPALPGRPAARRPCTAARTAGRCATRPAERFSPHQAACASPLKSGMAR